MRIRGGLDQTSGAGLPPAMGLRGTVLLFGSAGLLLGLVVHVLVPAAGAATGVEPVLLWFAFAGSVFLLPLIVVAASMLRGEPGITQGMPWRDRLRLQPMDPADWLWTSGALVAIGLLSLGSMTVLRALQGQGRPMFFVPMAPLTPGRYWILGAWLPFFLLNILGEEFVWRGVALPRQEVVFGRRAWIVNGLAHLLLHLPTGFSVLLVLWPTAFVLPYVVQRRRSTWAGVVIHGALNGPGFVAVALGLV